MNRVLPLVNAVGVFFLTILCVAQWRANRRLHLEANEMIRVRDGLIATLEEQKRAMVGQGTDLEALRGHLLLANARAQDQAAKLSAVEADARQLAVERDQLKASVTNWSAAVAVRDERLKAAAAQARELGNARDEAVVKFNDLALRYNEVVKDLNEARAAPSERRAQ